MTRRLGLLALAASGLFVMSRPSFAVHAQLAFRSRTDLVSVYVTVTDKTGHLVQDLPKEDFEVKDEGKVQTITNFGNGIQPITIVVMLDRSGSMEENFPLVKDASEQFVRKLLPGDKARIGNFSRQILIDPPDFTGNQEALIDILVHGMQDVGPSPVWTSVDRSITALLNQDGRRVVLLFSDGHDAPRPGQVYTDLKDVIRRSEIDEVMVYAIGLADTNQSLSSFLVPNRVGQIRVGQNRAETIKPDPGLKRLADQSGGGYFELTWKDNLGAVFTRVADELHHQYALAFPPQKLDGKIHKLEVKVKRPDVIVRARKSYVAEAR